MNDGRVGEVLWAPDEAWIEATRMHAFGEFCRARFASIGPGFADLYQWSIGRPDEFWNCVWEFFEIVGERGETVVAGLSGIFETKWFPRARLNFAENLLRHRGSRIALVEDSEGHAPKRITRDELAARVGRCQAWLGAQGVTAGDRVAAYMPNRIETVIAMLATTALGAVWSSCSPDFGVKAALDRLGQIRPKILLAAESYIYAGKRRPVLDRARDLFRQIETVQKLLIVSDTDLFESGSGEVSWIEAVEAALPCEPEFERLPFDHPVYILFSSGTTGLPKGIVHGAGGTLLQHFKELGLHTNVGEGTRIAYYTTCGWMMWNWLVSALGLGAEVVLIDGSPLHPTDDRLFRIAESEHLYCLGVSAKYLALAQKRGVRPVAGRDLSALRCILSTGSPLSPESFDYVYREVKSDLQLSSIAGFPGDARFLLERSRPRALPESVLRAFCGCVAPRRLGADQCERRNGFSRSQRYHLESRWSAYRNGGDLPCGGRT